MASLNLLTERAASRKIVSRVTQKELDYIDNCEQAHAIRDRPLLGYFGKLAIPAMFCTGVFFLGSYLYHRLIPFTELLPQEQCHTILNQIYKAWTVAITESSRQEQKLLEEYQHLHHDQQAHLVQVLRQALLNDLLITEQTIFKLQNITKQQLLASIDYYTTTTKTITIKKSNPNDQQQQESSLLASAASLFTSNIGGSGGDSQNNTNNETIVQQLPDQKMVKLKNELLRFVHLVLPTPDLPRGWTSHSALELLSQWFELRIVVMEQTYYSLGLGDYYQQHLTLSTEQLKELNTVYLSNVQQATEVFCVEKGVSQEMVDYLNKCVVNHPQFDGLTKQYRDQQQHRFAAMGLMTGRR